MIKKILGLIAFVIITIVAIINVNFDMNNSDISDLNVANMEALAIGEGALPYENMKGRNVVCLSYPLPKTKWECYCPHDGEYSSCTPKDCYFLW